MISPELTYPAGGTGELRRFQPIGGPFIYGSGGAVPPPATMPLPSQPPKWQYGANGGVGPTSPGITPLPSQPPRTGPQANTDRPFILYLDEWRNAGSPGGKSQAGFNQWLQQKYGLSGVINNAPTGTTSTPNPNMDPTGYAAALGQAQHTTAVLSAPPPIQTTPPMPGETTSDGQIGLTGGAPPPAPQDSNVPATITGPTGIDQAAASLLGTGTNAYGPGGTDQSGTGPPASVAGLQALAPVQGPAAAQNPMVILLIVAALAVAGYFAWKHFGKHAKAASEHAGGPS